MQQTITWQGQQLDLPLFSCDVLIIGSGLAGLYTALNLDSQNQIVLLNKDGPESSNSMRAQGGIAAALADDDSPDLHWHDSLRAGAGHCNPAAVRCLVDEAAAHIRQLLEWGVPFDCNADGQLELGREAAHSRNRVAHCQGDATGLHMTSRLLDHIRLADHIRLENRCMLVDLLTDKTDQISGALVWRDGPEPSLVLWQARHLVLATGGLGGLFARTTNHPSLTGDGLAAAIRAGCLTQDLEFIQFHPTALYSQEDRESCFLISEAVRGEGAVLRDHRGQAFMQAIHPLADLAPRDIVARAIARQMLQEKTDHVWLDATHLDRAFFQYRFPTIYNTCRSWQLNPEKDWIPVTPAQHYCMGGIWTDLEGRTSLPGLYACGEAACTGVYGANRLASNSLLECLVFAGRTAGAINRHKSRPLEPLCSQAGPQEEPAGQPDNEQEAAEISRQIREQMSRHCGILRNRADLAALKQQLAGWQEILGKTRPGSQTGLETRNMLLAAEAVVQAALARPVSLGAHYWQESG